LYSPAAVWAVLTLQEGWRWELLGPQIRHMPGELRILIGAVLALIAFWLWLTDESGRLYVGLAAMFSAAGVLFYWLDNGSLFF
jgi:hypothetical protein